MQLNEYESRFFRHEPYESNPAIRLVSMTEPRLTEEDNIEEFGTALFALVDKFNCGRIVLNLEQLDFVTSSALGKVITLHRKLARIGGKMVVCNVGDEMRGVLRASHLYSYFAVVDNLAEAIDQLS